MTRIEIVKCMSKNIINFPFRQQQPRKALRQALVYQIQNLVALEKLTIENHYYLRKPSVNLLKICAPLSNLKELSAINIKIIPFDEPCSVMWGGLKSLKLIRCEVCTELPDCQELTYLDIDGLSCQIEGYVLRFILKNGGNLKELYESCEPPIKADEFHQLLRGCPKLRYFYTPMEYIKLYLDYVSTIVEILVHNGVSREDPLELVITRRIKWKWFRRLLLRTTNAELIDLYVTTE
ncbi:uncharacterized protein [Drosophila takahashii]|uniref:uncharacterized protein isoform X1 n=1 Tax=Drosophila takahashii TaxID=29030 RepID=UPI003898FC95